MARIAPDAEFEHAGQEKTGYMLGSVQGKWIVWIRAAAICVAVLALLAAGLATPPDIDHDGLTGQPAVASVIEAGKTGEGSADPVPESECHTGQGCISVILPGNALILARTENASVSPRVSGYRTSGARYPPFHPPRVLSQI